MLIKFIEYLWEVDSIRQNKYQGLFIVFKFVLNENNKREISVSLYLTEIKIVYNLINKFQSIYFVY